MKKRTSIETLATPALAARRVLAVGLVLVASLALTEDATASTIVVNSTADNTTAADGNCTLREAIDCFNGACHLADCGGLPTNPVTIMIGAGTYSISGASGEDANASGDFDILGAALLHDLTIAPGIGIGPIVVDGAGIDRVFDVPASAVNVASLTLQGFTVSSGKGGDGGCVQYEGGAAAVLGFGGLRLANMTVQGCQGGKGGAVYFNAALGVLVVTASSIGPIGGPSNTASVAGGGIAVEAVHAIGVSTPLSVQISTSTIAGNSSAGNGGGVWLNPAAGDKLLSVDASSQITGNSATSGAGVWLTLANMVVTMSSIDNNTATTDGGGIAATASGALTLNGGAQITGNGATGNGGGIDTASNGVLTINAGAQVNGNTAQLQGGGIHASAGTNLSIAGGQVMNNTAHNSGGGLAGQSASIVLNPGTLVQNRASNDGGGIFCTGCTLIFSAGSSIIQNHADAGVGGGVRAQGGTLSCTSAIISNNDAHGTGAQGLGGGMFLQNVNAANGADLITSTFDSNTAQTAGGAVYARSVVNITAGALTNNRATNPASNGGAVYVDTGASVLVNQGANPARSDVQRNGAGSSGGAVFDALGGIYSAAMVDYQANTANSGGAIYQDSAVAPPGVKPYLVALCTFTSNAANAGNGGAIYISTNALQNTVTQSHFAGNVAMGDGGGVYNAAAIDPSAMLTIDRSSFASMNQAVHGGAICNQGAAPSPPSPGNIQLSNVTLDGNTAMSAGGGIFNGGKLAAQFCTITNNTAMNGGGVEQDVIGPAPPSATLTLANSILLGNGALGGPDCATGPGAIFGSLGGNLVSAIQPPGCGATFDPAGGKNDVVATSPVGTFLAPLALSPHQPDGSPVQTRALLVVPPAFADQAVNAANGAVTVGADARGVLRPQGGQRDIGAYETELDLKVTKAAPASVVAGAPLDYTLTVSNLGNIDAPEATIADNLPGVLRYQGVSAPLGWGCGTQPAIGGSGLLQCSAPLFTTAAAPAVFTVHTVVDPATAPTALSAQSIVNGVGVFSLLADRDPGPATGGSNSDSKTTTVTGSAVVTFTIAHQVAAPPARGTPVTYTLTLQNAGPSTLTNGSLAAGPLDAKLTAIGWSCTGSGGAMCQTLPTSSGSGDLPGTFPLVLPPFGGVVITLQAFIAANAAATAVAYGGTLTGPSYTSPVTANDAGFTVDPSTSSASLQASVLAAPTTPLSVGDSVTFTAQGSNMGPAIASNEQLTLTAGSPDTALSAFTLGSFGTTTCATMAKVGDSGPIAVTCRCDSPCVLPVAPFANGPSVTLLVTKNQGGVVGATNAISATNGATGGTAGTASVPLATSDLAVVASAAPSPAAPNDAVTVTLTVTNAGPNDAAGVTFSANLPANAAYLGQSAFGYACQSEPSLGAAGGTLACTRQAALAASQSESVSFTVQVASDASDGDTLDFAIATGSGAFDANNKDNSATLSVPVALGSGAGSGGPGGDSGGANMEQPDVKVRGGFLRCRSAGSGGGRGNDDGSPPGELALIVLLVLVVRRRLLARSP